MADLNEHAVEQIFRAAGAVLEGHFLLTSGRHSPAYWEKFQVLQWPQHTERLCRALAEHYRSANVEVVVGPTTGGIILAYEVARQLGVRGIFVENDPDRPGHRALRRGFQVRPGERVLIVDDVLTAGTSIREVLEALAPFQPDIVGIGVLIDRSGGGTREPQARVAEPGSGPRAAGESAGAQRPQGPIPAGEAKRPSPQGQADFGVPLHALLHLSIPSYAPADCPLCAEGQPLVKPGSRKSV